MTDAHRRHDLSDKDWALIEPHLPGRKGAWGCSCSRQSVSCSHIQK